MQVVYAIYIFKIEFARAENYNPKLTEALVPWDHRNNNAFYIICILRIRFGV